MKDLDGLDGFASFLKGNSAPPAAVEAKLLIEIRKALNPSLPSIVLKFLAFHVMGSFVTLLFCPQFGLSLVSSIGILPEYLMRLHPAACFIGCGLSWMIGGQALTYAFLTIDEQRVLGHLRWGSAFTILFLSILLFACLGRLQVDEWLGLWVLGATLITGFFNWRTARTLRRCHIKVGVLGF